MIGSKEHIFPFLIGAKKFIFIVAKTILTIPQKKQPKVNQINNHIFTFNFVLKNIKLL